MASIQTVAPVIGEFTALPFPEYIPCCDILFQSLTSLFMALRALLFYMELLKCHSIFVRFFISSNKFVDPSIVIFKPTGYFPSSSCHLNCRRFSTLDELLFCMRYNMIIVLICK